MVACFVMDQIMARHGVFAPALAPTTPYKFTLLYCRGHLAHGTVWSLSKWQTDLSRYQGTRVQAALEQPEAKYLGFEFCRRGVPELGAASLQGYQLLSKMPPL